MTPAIVGASDDAVKRVTLLSHVTVLLPTRGCQQTAHELQASNDASWMTDGDIADGIDDSFDFTSRHSQMVTVTAIPITGPLGLNDGCSSIFLAVEYYQSRLVPTSTCWTRRG